MKKKLAKRIEKLDSLRSKMKAKYGSSDMLVVELGKEVAEAQTMLAILKGKAKFDSDPQDLRMRHH